MEPYIHVTKHAISKCMDLLGITDEERARKTILKMLEDSTEVNIDPHHAAIRTLRNQNHIDSEGKIKESKYFERGEYRMVVVENSVVTFEKKWKEKKRRRRSRR